MCWHLLLVFFLMPAVRAAGITETVCGTMELHKLEDFKQLRNCTLVVGHIHIAQMELQPNINVEELRSEVMEITDYLMVYRSNGLHTLQSIFPRLRLIRGKELLFDRYALTVYENRHLRELGLVQLLRIQKGDIRIESNPMLCFVKTVNWPYLLGNSTQQIYYIKSNKPRGHCPVCGGLSADYTFRANNSIFCWNLESMQLQPTSQRNSGCKSACGRNGCDEAGNCCQRSCITGCSAQNCELCGTVKRDGRCVDQCVPYYQLYKRSCISSKECRNLNRIPLVSGYSCADNCPDNHKPVIENGVLTCHLNCEGLIHIRHAVDLLPLRDCGTINGSLVISLVDIKEKIVSALEEALVNVTEITGYLKIFRSTALMSLGFLKNLNTIRGNQLIEGKYALYVVDNHHLEQIWPSNHKVAILQGNIFFHLNPRLCYEKIKELVPSVKGIQHISVADVSPNSNGERVICGNVKTLNVTIEARNATAVRIKTGLTNFDDLDTLMGYTYFYMESSQENVTKYDGRHGCGHDNWLMDFSTTKNCRQVISGLKPFTQYAYFVKTITRTDYHMQSDAYSPIEYFTTLPSKPSPVARLYGSSEQDTQIILNWWPPRRPNGNINSYYVYYEAYNVTNNDSSSKTVSDTSSSFHDCECKEMEPYHSGPQPEDELFYSKDQLTYEDALPNLIYVSWREMNTKKEKFAKVKKFEDLPPLRKKGSEPQVTTTTMAPEIRNETKQEKMAREQYNKYQEDLKLKSESVQDNGIADFPIIIPRPKCADEHASKEVQQMQKCVVPDEPKGTQIPGTQHYYYLTELKPNQHYRITLRACVADVPNGCSDPVAIVVKTISGDVEEFLLENEKNFKV